jgi:hypothetical protein
MKLNELSEVAQQRNLKRLTAFFNKYSRHWTAAIMRNASADDFPADKNVWENKYYNVIFNSEPFISMRQGNAEKFEEYFDTYQLYKDELFDIVWQRIQRHNSFNHYSN